MAERNLDFDTVIDRRGTNCIKYDFAKERGYPENVLPLWVADMDFKTSSYVEDALKEIAERGIYGYSDTKHDYFEAVSGWLKYRHGWSVEERWLLKTPGVVNALTMAVKAYSREGEAVMIQSPVYYPFGEAVRINSRKLVSNDLILNEKTNSYEIDFDDFEKKIVENNVKLFLLCSPHNPVSRVWTKEELERMGDICLKHGVVVVADEIHSDFDFARKHTVFASIKTEFAQNSVTCTAPSKTFNLASLLLSNIFIPNDNLWRKFQKQLYAAGISQLSIFGIAATQAAYTHGREWYEAMKRYVGSNLDFIRDFTNTELSGVKLINHEGTYLAWLDFRALGFSADELDKRIVEKAGLWLDSGKIFGKSGEGFQRINAACPRKTLEEAMNRLKRVL